MAGRSYTALVRREWGSGSVYPVNGKWRCAVSLGRDPFGKRRRREWQFRTEEAAREKLREVTRRLDRGLPAEDSRVTLAAYAPEWLRSVKDVRPNTIAFYRAMLIHVNEIGHHRVNRLTPATVRALIERKQEEGYAPRTILGILDVLRQILRQAMADGIVERNVVELVRKPRLEQKEPAHFTAEQAKHFLEVTKDDSLHSLYAVALGTGLRRGELLALTWRDVERDAEHGGGSYISVRRGKTAAATRRVPLPGFAAAALGEWAARATRSGAAVRSVPIWPYSPSYVSRHLAELCERHGLPRGGMHILRHSCASILLAEGVPLEIIRQILGHARVSMSAHYARAEYEQKREALERLGRAVS